MTTPEVKLRTNSSELKTISGLSTRSRSHDPRGNSTDRRNRKNWMLSHPGFSRRPGTEGKNVNCVHCGTELNFNTVEADRRVPGGSYARHNIQPSCRTCNIRRSDNAEWSPPQQTEVKG